MAEANIPRFRAERAVVPGTYDPLRRPGSSGQRYFSDMQYANPNMAPREFDTEAAGYETQAAYDTRFNNSMDAAIDAARDTNTAQANQLGLANLANPARGTRPSAQTLSDAEVRQTFADIGDNPAYDTDRRRIEQSIGAMNRYNISPQRASELMNVPLADIRAMMSPYYMTFGERNSEGIANLMGGQAGTEEGGRGGTEEGGQAGTEEGGQGGTEEGGQAGTEEGGQAGTEEGGQGGTEEGGQAGTEEDIVDLLLQNGPQHGGAYTFTDDGGLAVADPQSLTAWTYIASEDIFISRIDGAQIDNTPEAILAARESGMQSQETVDTPEADVATGINLSAIAEVLRGGSQTPAEAARAAGISEEELIVQLIRANETNFAEVAAYYQDRFPGITAAQVEANYRNTEFAQGGNVNGYYLGGPTDGMADQIPATIDNSQPAALSDGEFVIPADVVSHLGNGNSSAGATQLHGMMDKVRQARTGSTKQGREINPNKFLA